MKIKIVPVESQSLIEDFRSTELQTVEPVATTVDNIERVFAEFIEMDVGDGAASPDTVKSYLPQTKIYLTWCKNISFTIRGLQRFLIK